MAANPLPDQETLLKLLRYEPDTGKLFWLPRHPNIHNFTQRRCDKFNVQFAGKEAFTSDNGCGYKVATIFGVTLRAHRVIWCMIYGYWPDHIDHIDQNRSNNRIANLREAGRIGNARNSRLSKRNKSGRTGVHWRSSSQKWRVKIRHEGKHRYLGEFDDFKTACRVRSEAEKQFGYSPLHGKAKSG